MIVVIELMVVTELIVVAVGPELEELLLVVDLLVLELVLELVLLLVLVLELVVVVAAPYVNVVLFVYAWVSVPQVAVAV